MYKYLVLIFIFPLTLIGQEQVSDIKYYGVYEPTLLSGRAGFVVIDDEQYFLKEHDSLIISKIVNGSLQKHAVIKRFDNKQWSHSTLIPNRSLFEIRDGKYYRFYINGVQVIDIKNGFVLFQFDFDKEGFISTTLTSIYSDNIFFKGNRNNKLSNYALNTISGLVSELDLPADRNNYPQVLSYIPGISSGSTLHMFDASQNKDHKILESHSDLKFSTYTSADSMIAFVETNGALWLLDHDLTLTDTGCILDNVSALEMFRLTGDRIVVIFNIPNLPDTDLVEVWNIWNCTKELTFLTDNREYYATNLRFTFSENNDHRFTIFGYSGEDPTDGFNRGLYYFIDHVNNKYTNYNDLSQILSFTPFKLDDAIYCIGVDGSIWNSRMYVLKYDINSAILTKLFPSGQNISNSVVLGYPEEEEIILANNTIHEESGVWKLNLQDVFRPMESLNFLINIGVHQIGKILPVVDRLYFTNKTGLYSVFNDARLEIFYNNAPKILGFNGGGLPTTQYGDKIAYCEFIPNKIIFWILDTATGQWDSLVLNENISDITVVPAGPFIFFSKGNSNSLLQYFDLRNKSVHSYDRLPWMIAPNMYPGEKRAIYLQKSFAGNQPAIAHLIDYETNSIKDVIYDLQRQVEVVRGSDDAFYFIDRGIGSENSRIRLLKKDGTFQTIYNGDGIFYKNTGFAHDPSSSVVLFSLIHKGQTSVLISNNQINTQIHKIQHEFISNTGTSILSYKADKFLLRKRESDGFHYWLYSAFGNLVEVEGPSDKIFRAAAISDSLAVILFLAQDSTLFLTKYDFIMNIREANENLITNCNYLNGVSNIITLSDNIYLLTASCQSGIEPWILDIERGTISLLADINPGALSSFPSDFIWYKDWIYFTATIADNSRQWFRYLLDSPSSVVEPIPIKSKSLTVYPSPASDMIHFDQDFEEINFYNAQGQSVQVARKYIAGQSIQFGHLDIGIYLFMALDHQNKLHTGKVIVVR